MSGRGSSRPWNRLKPAQTDILESIGLISKGDKSLLDHKTQERLYRRIVEKYLTFCGQAKNGSDLLDKFASLHISSATALPAPEVRATKETLSTVLTALRKLREGIVATKRTDDWAQQAYLFNIRVALLVKHHESYVPALLHLLRFIHPRNVLSVLELREAISYLVLDTACRREDLEEAFRLRRQYALCDAGVDAVLRALAHDDYVAFRRMKGQLDGHIVKIMEYADDSMRRRTLKCIAAAYMTIDLASLEKFTGSTWAALVKEGVQWRLDENGKTVTLKAAKAKS